MSALEDCTDAERAAVLAGNAHVYRVTTRGDHAGGDLRR